MEADESKFWARSYSSSSTSSSSNSNSSNIKPFIIAFLSATIISILFFPSILNSSFKTFRPTMLKSGWDLLNFILVLFAVLCGVLGRNTASEGDTDTSSAPSLDRTRHHQTNPTADANEWGPQNRPIRRMRSSSSYPDLRQEAWWGPPDGNDSWRFYDDSYFYNRRSGHLRYGHHHQQQPIDQNISDDGGSGHPRYGHHQHSNIDDDNSYNDDGFKEAIKTIQVDAAEEEVVKEPTPVRSRSPPPPPPPPLQQHQHQPRRRHEKKSIPDPPPPPPRQQHQHQPRQRHVKNSIPDPPPPPPRQQVKRSEPPPPPPPLPPPTPPRPKLQRKKSSGAKDIAAAFAQFYQKKRKRSGTKIKKQIHNNNDEVVITDAATRVLSSPPPPPPLPPPSFKFQNIFSNKSKKSKDPIPKSKSKHPLPYSPLRPMPHEETSSLPPKVSRDNSLDYYFSKSYSFEILPPPPPPPPESAPGSPVVSKEAEQVFCPSPDLNVKADMFIKRFRDGLKLEKLNSIKAKEMMRGNEAKIELS